MSTAIEQSAVDVAHHVVQFYEDDAELVARVGGYLRAAARDGAVGVVLATEAHRAAFESYLRDAGVDVVSARDDGTLVTLDAETLLARLMNDGRFDGDAFLDIVGGIVREAAATGRPVCAYGELVALLWETGDVVAAIELEELWNELATEVPFSLHCAYSSDSVAGHEHADALQRVCDLHSAVLSAPPVDTTWRFAPENSAPAQARDRLTAALRRAGHDGDLLDDARLVMTELAANAVVHARSPFAVSVSIRGSTLRIAVRDGSRVSPAMHDPSLTLSARGLHLIAALTRRWGVELADDGKVVWAELDGS